MHEETARRIRAETVGENVTPEAAQVILDQFFATESRQRAIAELPRIAYIAMPYRAKTEWELVQNIRAAECLALKYWRLGYAVFCPHKNTAWFGGAAPDEVWLKGDLAILARSDVIVMGPGWHNSSGATAEYNRAREWGIEVIFDDQRVVMQSCLDKPEPPTDTRT